jgi:hypothetical protein
MLAKSIIGQSRHPSLNDGVVAVVDGGGVVSGLSEDAVGLVIRVVWSDELSSYGDSALTKVSQSPATGEIFLIPPLEVV